MVPSFARFLSITLLGLAAWCGLIPTSLAAASAEVVDTHPAPNATLGREQPFFVRIAFETDEPVNIWVRPFRDGVQITQVMSNGSPRHTGSGEALGWFALLDAGTVDEVRVLAGGGKPYREWELARYPVDLRWTEAMAAREPPAQWVEDLRAVEEQRRREDFEKRAAEPVSAGEMALFSGFMLFVLALMLAGIALPVWAMWKWRGGWRIAAAAPLAAMAFVIVRILVDTARDPTSHNLWPFEILMFAPGSLVFIGVLMLARRVTRARTA